MIHRALRLIVLLVSFLAISVLSFAQDVTITPHVNGLGLFRLEQLQYVSLINGTPEVITGELEIVVEDRRGQLVVRLKSAPVAVQAGGRLSGRELNWGQAPVFGASPLVEITRHTGFFATGQYTICYWFREPGSSRVIGNHCREDNIGSQLGLPELLSPANREMIYSSNPLLLWKAPYPLSGAEIRYNLKLVEFPSGQSIEQALRFNTPLLSLNGISGTQMIYPPSGIALESGKRYAWQVEAFIQSFPLGATEIWSFEIASPQGRSVALTENNECFRSVKPGWKANAPYYFTTDTLYFSLDNYRGLDTLDYEVLAFEGELIDANQLPSKLTVQGINRLVIALSDFPFSVIQGKPYVITLSAGLNRKYYLPFIYQEQ